MTLLPKGLKVHLAVDLIDMRKGIDGLAMLVQGALRQDPFSGHLFVFRGRKANLIKIVYWDGTGLCLFTKRLEQSTFRWPSSGRSRRHTDADLGATINVDRWHRMARSRTMAPCCGRVIAAAN